MALSGIAIVGFVIVHLIGAWKIFLGPVSTNEYGEALRELGEPLFPRTHLLWFFRGGLIAAFAVHLHAAFSLHRRNRWASGSSRSSRSQHLAATYASRTMLWSGVIVGLFVLFHLADLTWGATNPDFASGNPYNNQIASFKNPIITTLYLLGVSALTSHLFHGFWSMAQSLGTKTTLLDESDKRRLAAAMAIMIGAGYASMPLAVLLGLLDFQ